LYRSLWAKVKAFLFDRLCEPEAGKGQSNGSKDGLHASVINELRRVFSRRSFFLSDEGLSEETQSLPYGPSEGGVDLKVGAFVGPEAIVRLRQKMLKAVRENEPRLQDPKLEITPSRSNQGDLNFILSGRVNDSPESLSFSSSSLF
jgi:predicted component of type VI protein secretion system